MKRNEDKKTEWRDGVYLCTAESSLEADILESKLRGEGIPSERRWKGAGNFLEIVMGVNTVCPVDIYVPADCLEDAQNVIIPFPIAENGTDDGPPEA